MMRRARVFVVLAAASLVAVSSAVAFRDWRGEMLLGAAGEERKRGDINGAAELYAAALRHGRVEAAVALARMAYFRRDWEGVRRWAGRAAAVNPLQGYPHVLLAFSREAEGALSSGAAAEVILDECRRAVALEPSNAGLWRSCADLALRLSRAVSGGAGGPRAGDGYRREAIDAYRRALALNPGDGYLRRQLSEITD